MLRAWGVARPCFDKPLLCAFSDMDPIQQRGGNKALEKRVPARRGQAHATITGGGHFLREDRGTRLADVVIAFLGRVRRTHRVARSVVRSPRRATRVKSAR